MSRAASRSKIGPIAASFAGEGTVQRSSPPSYRQIIEGRGGDRKQRLARLGQRRLSADGRVAGADRRRGHARRCRRSSYALTGPLAQLGRSSLARDLVRRIGEAFAQNLDAELTDPGGAGPRHAELGGLSLIWQVLAARLRAMIGRLSGTRG